MSITMYKERRYLKETTKRIIKKELSPFIKLDCLNRKNLVHMIQEWWTIIAWKEKPVENYYYYHDHAGKTRWNPYSKCKVNCPTRSRTEDETKKDHSSHVILLIWWSYVTLSRSPLGSPISSTYFSSIWVYKGDSNKHTVSTHVTVSRYTA